MRLFDRSQLPAWGAVALLAVGVWAFVHNTEWVDFDRPIAPSREVARDGLYAAKALVRKLGGSVTAPDNFQTLPPPNATLLLTSPSWDLFEGRSASLRRWVEGGGHLVLLGTSDSSSLADWLPLKSVDDPPPAHAARAGAAAASAAKSDPTSSAATAPQAAAASTPEAAAAQDPEFGAGPRVGVGRKADSRDCHRLEQPAGSTLPLDGRRTLRVCGYSHTTLHATAPLRWAFDGRHGHEIASVSFGKGTVTAATLFTFLFNDHLLRADGALAFAAMLELRAGSEVWFVAEEARRSFLALLWSHGAPALVWAALALAFVLWRGARRFGPPVAVPTLARRSIVEQIRGTAHFIARHGGVPLHRAELRALDTMARHTVQAYDSLITQGDRATAIAAQTRLVGLDAGDLARAMDRTTPRSPRALGVAIGLLETARRALRDAARSSRDAPLDRTHGLPSAAAPTRAPRNRIAPNRDSR